MPPTWKRLRTSRRRELCAAVAFAISFVTPLLFLVGVEASAVACSPNCGNLYAGQVTHSTGYTGVRGYIAWPSTTLSSPSADGILHWLGLTQITDQSQGIEWLQFGAWNGYGSGGTGSSSVNYYREFKSWCNGYSVSTYGSTTSSTGRLNVVEYTGESYDCGSGGLVTVYKVEGWSSNTSNYKSVWVRYANSRADANDELKMYSYFEPLGGTVCYGASLSAGSCVSSTNLELLTTSWSNWIAGADSSDSRPSSYWHTTISSNYKFRVNGAY